MGYNRRGRSLPRRDMIVFRLGGPSLRAQLIVLSIPLCAIVTSCRGTERNGSDWKLRDHGWLGGDLASDHWVVKRLAFSDFEVVVEIVSGECLHLEETPNSTTWHVGGVVVTDPPEVRSQGSYLVASIHPSSRRWRFASCIARVAEGALEGALIRVHPPVWACDGGAVAYSVFEVPDHVLLCAGKVRADVVELVVK